MAVGVPQFSRIFNALEGLILSKAPCMSKKTARVFCLW